MSCPDGSRGSVDAHAKATGEVETLHKTKCYVTPPRSTTPTSKSQIIYLTDSFGLNLINAKLLADHLAAATGCRVLIPDVIPGGGGPVALMHYREEMHRPIAWETGLWNVLAQLGLKGNAAFWTMWYTVPLGIRVLTRSSPQNAYGQTILPFVRAVREAGPEAEEAKLGVVGFCWGGYGSVNLCKECGTGDRSGERLVDVQFCGHPYGLKTPDMIVDAVRKKVPFSMAVGDKDQWFHIDKVEETEAALRKAVGNGLGENDCYYEVKVYEGCTHGFVVRADPNSVVENAAADRARQQAVEWLRRYL